MHARLLSLAIALSVAAGGAGAASSAIYSISDSLTTSSQASSDSFRASSRASSPRPPRLAEGDYRIVEVVAVAERPDRVQLELAAVGRDGDGFVLELPRAVVDAARLAAGDVVKARQRAYGVEFAHGAPFFLVLDDDVQRELQARPIAL